MRLAGAVFVVVFTLKVVGGLAEAFDENTVGALAELAASQIEPGPTSP
jgi:hypothetical protein